MGKKTVQLDESYIFPDRFMTLCSTERKTLEEWGHIFLVTRQTISNWQTGKSIPSIVDLMRITEYFHVSADYLIGISDTESPDVGVRASVAYTGLSERAVKMLHIGLDDCECDGDGLLGDSKAEETKAENLNTASKLIQSGVFTEIVCRLSWVAEEAYLEKILEILHLNYCNCCSPEEDDDFYFRSEVDREIVKDNLIHVLTTELPWEKENTINRVCAMDDGELAEEVFRALMNAKTANELHQFHAGKALTGYINRIVEESCKRAEQRFASK